MKNFTSGSQRIGELGENIACTYLKNNDFKVIERNYTKKWGEIDIIAEKGGTLYFIEVKSVSRPLTSDGGQAYTQNVGISQKQFRPEENMHPWKMKRLSRTIQTYLIHKRIGNRPWQFDLMLVFLDLSTRKAWVKRMENVIL